MSWFCTFIYDIPNEMMAANFLRWTYCLSVHVSSSRWKLPVPPIKTQQQQQLVQYSTLVAQLHYYFHQELRNAELLSEDLQPQALWAYHTVYSLQKVHNISNKNDTNQLTSEMKPKGAQTLPFYLFTNEYKKNLNHLFEPC